MAKIKYWWFLHGDGIPEVLIVILFFIFCWTFGDWLDTHQTHFSGGANYDDPGYEQQYLF